MISRFRGHVKYDAQTWLDSVKRDSNVTQFRCFIVVTTLYRTRLLHVLRCVTVSVAISLLTSLVSGLLWIQDATMTWYREIEQTIHLCYQILNHIVEWNNFHYIVEWNNLQLLSCSSCMCMKKGNAERLCCFVFIKIENGGDWDMCVCLRVCMCACVSEI